MNRKILVLILAAAIFCLFFLAACSKKDAGAQQQKTELDSPELKELDTLSAELDNLTDFDMGISSVQKASEQITFNTKVNVSGAK